MVAEVHDATFAQRRDKMHRARLFLWHLAILPPGTPKEQDSLSFYGFVYDDFCYSNVGLRKYWLGEVARHAYVIEGRGQRIARRPRWTVVSRPEFEKRLPSFMEIDFPVQPGCSRC